MSPKRIDNAGGETVPITLRVPTHFTAKAEEIAKLISTSGFEATPQDAMRAAMERGFEELAAELGPFRVSAWDGARTTCLFGIGYTKEQAVAYAKQLAGQHAGGRWTVFRVFQQGEFRKPTFVAHVEGR